MPNWVFNSVIVSGEKSELDKLVAQLNKPYDTFYPEMNRTPKEDGSGFDVEWVDGVQHHSNPIFAFWNVVSPDPADFEEYFAIEAKSKSEVPLGDPNWWAGIIANQSVSKHWYDWNNHHWDTKWDCSVKDGDEYPDTRMEMTDDGSVMYHFQTAWSPVHTIFERLAQMYPSLEFDYEYEEEQGWGGKAEWVDGELSNESQYDIPNSHADHIERDKECNCEVESDYPEYWYQDCPVDTAKYEWIEEDKEWAEKTLDNASSV